MKNDCTTHLAATDIFFQELLSAVVELYKGKLGGIWSRIPNNWAVFELMWLQWNKGRLAKKPEKMWMKQNWITSIVWFLQRPAFFLWSWAWICYIPYHMWRAGLTLLKCTVKSFVWSDCLPPECPLIQGYNDVWLWENYNTKFLV